MKICPKSNTDGTNKDIQKTSAQELELSVVFIISVIAFLNIKIDGKKEKSVFVVSCSIDSNLQCVFDRSA